MESLLLFYVEKPLLHILYIVSFPDLICIFLFQHVEEASVRIIVMANIQISPPVVYPLKDIIVNVVYLCIVNVSHEKKC